MPHFLPRPLLSWLLLLVLAPALAAPFTPGQEARIRELIRETLIQNPAILDEAAESWQRQQEASQQAELHQQLERNQQALFDSATSPRLGALDPAFTLILFTDYHCPYCRRLEPQVQRLLAAHPKLGLIIKLLPFQGDQAKMTARQALTLWQQKPAAFPALHQALMSGPPLTQAAIAKALNAGGAKAKTPSSASAREINVNLHLARQLGIEATPTLLIGDQLLPGVSTYERLEQTLLAEQGKHP